MRILLKILLYSLVFSLTFSCGKGFFKKVDTRDVPISGPERAKKNVKEGRGVSLGGLARGRGNTNYEFSTSNPMWRASLEVLDFLPMTTVDYSGGVIITDWYTDNSSSNQDSIKITIRFLSNEIRSDSLKIIVHKKRCDTSVNCSVKILENSTISQELRTTIIREASLLEKDPKSKKR